MPYTMLEPVSPSGTGKTLGDRSRTAAPAGGWPPAGARALGIVASRPSRKASKASTVFVNCIFTAARCQGAGTGVSSANGPQAGLPPVEPFLHPAVAGAAGRSIGKNAFALAALLWLKDAHRLGTLSGLFDRPGHAAHGPAVGAGGRVFVDRVNRRRESSPGPTWPAASWYRPRRHCLPGPRPAGAATPAVLVRSLGTGLLDTFSQPSIMAAIPDLVPREKLEAANGLNLTPACAPAFLAVGVLYRLSGRSLLVAARWLGPGVQRAGHADPGRALCASGRRAPIPCSILFRTGRGSAVRVASPRPAARCWWFHRAELLRRPAAGPDGLLRSRTTCAWGPTGCASYVWGPEPGRLRPGRHAARAGAGPRGPVGGSDPTGQSPPSP